MSLVDDNLRTNRRLKTAGLWAGRILLVVSIAFIAWELSHHWTAISLWQPTSSTLLWLTALAVAYAVSLWLLVEGWHQIITVFAPEERIRTYPSFAITQIAKYLPGNIAHLIGRGLYLKGGKISASQIVKATIAEMAVIPLGALVWILLAGSAGTRALEALNIPDFAWPIMAVVLATVLAALALYCTQYHTLNGPQLRRLIFAALLSVLFMLALGLIYAAIFGLVGVGPTSDLLVVAIAAWLAGFLTPGAPGGIGIREATLLLLLGHLELDSSVLLSAALFRIITVSGDFLLFTASWIVYRKQRSRF
ncbi:lysylphosphatidylglycerol synthase domain-containing protein [Roseibium sp.]|uniref:lysylphosphatidylglycerol synthase domain-containing protein n=1 Tax=Roseibium sp. TaxID=1936156 RepID=UPI00391CABB3